MRYGDLSIGKNLLHPSDLSSLQVLDPKAGAELKDKIIKESSKKKKEDGAY